MTDHREPLPACTILTVEVDGRDADVMEAWFRDDWGVATVRVERTGAATCWLELYFDLPAGAELAEQALASHTKVKATGRRDFSGQDWDALWRRHFPRRGVGTRLEICPPWETDAPVEPGRTRVLINPGMGFGTGEHFTTRFCLEMLDRLCQNNRPASLLDVGTGSGILAVAAARLGVPRVEAWDSDPLCIEQARANAALNEVAVAVERVDLRAPPGRTKYDVVCANLYGSLLLEAAARLVKMTGTALVLSGLRDVEAEGVGEAFALLGLAERARDGDGEWAGLLFMVPAESTKNEGTG